MSCHERLGVSPTMAMPTIGPSQLWVCFTFTQPRPHDLLPCPGLSLSAHLPFSLLLVWFIWLTVSLIPWLLEIHAVWFSGTSGHLLILDCLLSSFWLCEEAKGFYLCLHLVQHSDFIYICYQIIRLSFWKWFKIQFKPYLRCFMHSSQLKLNWLNVCVFVYCVCRYTKFFFSGIIYNLVYFLSYYMIVYYKTYIICNIPYINNIHHKGMFFSEVMLNILKVYVILINFHFYFTISL